MTLTLDDQDALTNGWFGYGNWNSPYWFVGMEPGGDEGVANFLRWDQLGRGELLDIFAHHETHPLDWFSDVSGTQSTWAKLIRLLLAYKGIEPTRAATLNYQRAHLGRLNDETALLELSALAAAHTRIDVQRTLNRAKRIQVIRQRLTEMRPEFVVFYSTKPVYAEAWSQIAGTPLLEGQPVIVDTTAFLMSYHPQYKRGKVYWVELAQRLRNLRGGSSGPTAA